MGTARSERASMVASAASAWALRAASRAASSFRSTASVRNLVGTAAKAKPKRSSVGVNAFRSTEGGLVQTEGRLLSRHRLRLSPAVSPGARSAFALYRNFMVSDCLFLFDEDIEGT